SSSARCAPRTTCRTAHSRADAPAGAERAANGRLAAAGRASGNSGSLITNAHGRPMLQQPLLAAGVRHRGRWAVEAHAGRGGRGEIHFHGAEALEDAQIDALLGVGVEVEIGVGEDVDDLELQRALAATEQVTALEARVGR